MRNLEWTAWETERESRRKEEAWEWGQKEEEILTLRANADESGSRSVMWSDKKICSRRTNSHSLELAVQSHVRVCVQEKIEWQKQVNVSSFNIDHCSYLSTAQQHRGSDSSLISRARRQERASALASSAAVPSLLIMYDLLNSSSMSSLITATPPPLNQSQAASWKLRMKVLLSTLSSDLAFLTQHHSRQRRFISNVKDGTSSRRLIFVASVLPFVNRVGCTLRTKSRWQLLRWCSCTLEEWILAHGREGGCLTFVCWGRNHKNKTTTKQHKRMANSNEDAVSAAIHCPPGFLCLSAAGMIK